MRARSLILALSMLALAAPVWAGSSGGASGGGSGVASSVGGSATLPATCTELDLYQDTDSGGTEFYVCTATNTWTKTGTGTGTIGGTLGATDDLSVCTDGTGGSTIGACTVLNIDNLRLDGNTISSADTNGNIVLSPNGTGSIVVDEADTAATPAIRGATYSAGLYWPGATLANRFAWGGGGTASGWFGQAHIGLVGNGYLAWGTSTNNLGSGVNDLTLFRTAAGVLKVGGSDTAGSMWINSAGSVALAADFTDSTATLANMTGLTVTLKTARKYMFRMVLRLSDSVAGEGLKFDFDGGTVTATDFGVNCQVFDSALLLSSDATALATDFAVATATGASKVVCDGSLTVNVAGTFIPRAAQNTHSTGTLTVELGSALHVTDASFN